MPGDPSEIVRAHIVRRPRRRSYGDGFPDPGTPSYQALSPVSQLMLAERRAGVYRLNLASDSPAAVRLSGRTPNYETQERKST